MHAMEPMVELKVPAAQGTQTPSLARYEPGGQAAMTTKPSPMQEPAEKLVGEGPKSVEFHVVY